MHIGIMRKKKLFAASMWYSPLEPETFSIIYGKIETIAMKIYSKMIKLPTYFIFNAPLLHFNQQIWYHITSMPIFQQTTKARVHIFPVCRNSPCN